MNKWTYLMKISKDFRPEEKQLDNHIFHNIIDVAQTIDAFYCKNLRESSYKKNVWAKSAVGIGLSTFNQK